MDNNTGQPPTQNQTFEQKPVPPKSNTQTPMTPASETSEDTKTIITVLLLVFVLPVGVILMWVWTSWKSWVKWLISCFACCVILIPIVALFSVGFLAALNPEGALNKAECVSSCQNQGLLETELNYCITKCGEP